MSKFDTHGGYFAPKDYLRVNEGGSHEENPNGGVQIGVDPEGNPNLLEEGEPVYKDYVYSDNIEAEEQFLVDNNLPKKYTGKLYSKIADDLFSEAEERPLDPISRNGLEALLGRLADAQEGQKQAKEQKDLEEELANLSPEELDQLEAMLAQEEQGQVVPEQVPMEATPEQMMGLAEPMPVEGMPMMANGGTLLHKYDMGGPKKTMADEIASEILAQAGVSGRASGISNKDLPLIDEHPEVDVALMAAQPGGVMTKVLAPSAYRGMISGLANGEGAQAVIYGLSPETKEWVEISRRAADMQAGNSSKYALYKAVGKGEHLPSPIASRKANLVERGVTAEGEPYVVRVNEFADPAELERRATYWRNERYSGPDSWANSGSGSWKVHGHGNGGFLRMFDGGGKLTDEQKQAIIDAGPILDGSGERIPSLLELALGPDNRIVRGVNAARDWMENSTLGRFAGALLPSDATQAFAAPVAGIATDVANLTGKIADYGKDITAAEKELAALKKELDVAKKTKVGSVDVITSNIDKAKEKIKFAKREMGRLQKQLPKAQKAEKAGEQAAEATTEAVEQAANQRGTLGHAARTMIDPTYVGRKIWNKTAGSDWRLPATMAGGLIGGIPATAFWSGIGEGVSSVIDAYKTPVGVSSEGLTPYTGYYSNEMPEDLNFDDEPTGNLKASGGKINRYPNGGWIDFMNRLAAYDYSRNPSNVTGKYAIDRRSDVWGKRTAREIEADQAYKDFTNYVLAHSSDPYIQAYLHALDNGVAKGVPLLFDGNDNLVKNWNTLFEDRRTDGDLGIYHISPEDIGFLTAPAASATTIQNPQSPDIQYELFPGQLVAMQYGAQVDNLSPRMRYAMSYSGSDSPTANEANSAERVADDMIYEGNTNLLPTWPRYAGAIGSGLLGLYNAFQSPDRYAAPHINPVLPEGRINLQNQVYNPIDQNMIANAQVAQGNATNRALRNSGMGPSTGAAILAADNDLTGNLGTGFIQAWDANNQRRNAVLAANNQAEAQRAQFDYTVDAARKEAINRLAPYNAQNDLMIQRLNNQAEGEKYQAISNQISNGLQALSGIGQENFAMNQINTNPYYLGYRTAPNGAISYYPWYGCNGGFLKKYKK